MSIDLEVSVDPAPMNAILNSPGCREEHCPPGMLEENPNYQHDVSHIIRAGGFTVVGDRMGWVFNRVGHNVYEGHTAIKPEARGVASLTYMQQAIDEAFLSTDAMEILVRCPVSSPETIKAAQKLKMSKLYTASGIWGGVDMQVFSLSISNWAARCRRFLDMGQWLHDEFERNGALHEDHGDDDTHLCYAGISTEMALRGNAIKGAYLYNIYARMAGYDPVEVRCLDPLVIRTVWRDGADKSKISTIDYLMTRDSLEAL